MEDRKIKVLFCDVGGVLLTNGWDHNSRNKAAQKFGFNPAEMNTRHGLMFGDYETGRISLDEYLKYVVFYTPRNFTLTEFKEFMYAQSTPNQEMIDYMLKLKQANNLKFVIVSNEGKELTEHRVKKFNLGQLADCFIFSYVIGTRKPDKRVYEMALGIVQEHSDHVVYLDDRQLFVEVASSLGIKSIQHVNLESTRQAFAQLGLRV